VSGRVVGHADSQLAGKPEPRTQNGMAGATAAGAVLDGTAG
jgi:hypothetical protein